MVRLLAFVEGQTEEQFIRRIVAPALVARNVHITATTPGGVKPWPRIRREMLRYLKEDTGRFLTTMFDYFRMPADWPGRIAAGHKAHKQKAVSVEKAVLDDIAATMGNTFNKRRFIPYVQMHEFEALLFSDPGVLGQVIPTQDASQDLEKIAAGFTTPEEIDDDPNTAPSKRIAAICNEYQKVLHGILAARRIGLPLMRHKCPHFDEWLTKLEMLEQSNET